MNKPFSGNEAPAARIASIEIKKLKRNSIFAFAKEYETITVRVDFDNKTVEVTGEGVEMPVTTFT